MKNHLPPSPLPKDGGDEGSLCSQSVGCAALGLPGGSAS